ncbi:hypothetical protein [Phenylobacterium sp.]|uniref:hypothetical protein n=1 Tax=Phenylobacterium sp. TaxID=1871053 RepID=UPI002731BC87|nr:hypothetical protein [Phenylobacterium sp.]MDP1873550.1 hypothetical protein [Phenylobacterium sp.]
MDKKYARLAVVMAGALVAMLAFAPPGDRTQVWAVAGSMAVAAAIYAPAVRQLLLRHRRSVIAIGIATIAIGLIVLLVSLSSPLLDPKLGGMATGFLTLAGAFVISVPFIIDLVERNVAALAAGGGRAMAKREPPTFSPDGEVKAVLAEIGDHRAALLRVVGPWFILFCAVAMLPIMDIWNDPADLNQGLALIILLVLLDWVSFIILLVAMIQWARFTASKHEPRFTAFPGRALWGWAWRLVVAGVIFQSFGQLGPWLQAQLPAAAPWQLYGLEGVAGLTVFVLISSLAPILPAVALGAAEKGMAASMRGFRVVGGRFYLGVILIVTPYAAASWALSVLADHYKEPAALVANAGASLLLLFAASIVGIAYLTRGYLRGTEAVSGNAS